MVKNFTPFSQTRQEMDLIPGGVQACAVTISCTFSIFSHQWLHDRSHRIPALRPYFHMPRSQDCPVLESDLLIGSFVYRLKCHLESKCFIKLTVFPYHLSGLQRAGSLSSALSNPFLISILSSLGTRHKTRFGFYLQLPLRQIPCGTYLIFSF